MSLPGNRFGAEDDLRIEFQDPDAPELSPVQRNQLGYRILKRLYETALDGQPVRYSTSIPDHDEFELRSAASWLVENGYARWAGGAGISITDDGRDAVRPIVDLTQPPS